MTNMEIFTSALRVMGIGMGGVFVVLAFFFGIVKLMLELFPGKRMGAETAAAGETALDDAAEDDD